MHQIRKTIKTPTLYRNAVITLQRAAEGEERNREISFAFSSEQPVERWFGDEILDHIPQSVRMEFLGSGRAPLLLDHDWTKQVGVIKQASIDNDRMGRAVARFGRSELAEEVLADVEDEIRLNVSVGYRIHEMQLDKKEGDREIYRITDWEPLEVSIVSIPADTSVGVGRAAPQETEHDTIVITRQEKPAMDPEKVTLTEAELEKARSDKLAKEQTRIDEILALAARHNLRQLGEEHVRKGTTIEVFRGVVLDKIGDKPLETPASELGLSRKDVKRYSVMRAVAAIASRDFQKLAPFEFELSMAIADRIGKQARGFFVPFDIQQGGLWRDPRHIPPFARQIPGFAYRAAPMDTAENSDLVATMHLAGSFIEALRAESVVFALGARVLSGLVGNVDIPRNDTPASFGWIAENAASADTEVATGTVSLSPKTVSGSVPITRRLLLQSSPDVEMLVRNDLVVGASLAIDSASLQGSGSSNQPRGVINQSGIGTVTISSAGAPDWAEIVEFETDVAAANGLRGSLAYLTTPAVRGNMKTTEKASGTARFLLEGNESNGYPVIGTTQMPSNGILFGNFQEILVGFWGMLDINVDTATDAAKGGVVLRAFQDADTNVRHAVSFSKNA